MMIPGLWKVNGENQEGIIAFMTATEFLLQLIKMLYIQRRCCVNLPRAMLHFSFQEEQKMEGLQFCKLT